MSSYLTFDKGKNMKFGLPQGYTSGWGNAVDPKIALGQIAHDLPDISDGVANTFKSEDLSMPSPWAKLISYETVLFDSNGTYGAVAEQAVWDWRCLISIIALRDIIGIDLNVSPKGWDKSVNLANDGNQFARRFYKNVLQVYPQNSLFSVNAIGASSALQPTEWDIFTPILVKRGIASIGFLSNSTLVCPPYSFSAEAQAFLGSYPFFKMGKFINPVSWINSNPDYANIMKMFLNNLSDNVVNLSTVTSIPVNVNMCNKVNALITEFNNEIFVNGSVSVRATVANSGKYMNVRDLLSSIAINIPEPESDVTLITQKSNGSRLFIVGDSLFGIEANKDAANGINVIGNQKLSHLMPSFMSGDRIYGTYNLKPDEEIYRDSDLLMDKLFLINSRDSIINSGADRSIHSKIGGKDVIWPINKVLLKYMTVEELRNSIDISFDGSETYTVTLELSLARTIHRFSKSYSGKNIIIKEDYDLPHIAVWPYVKVEVPGGENVNLWKKYYVFKSSYSSTAHVEIKSDNDKPALNSVRLDLISNKDFERKYDTYEEIPSYIELYEKEGYNDVYCGSILLSPPEVKRISPHNDWTVGVDFGTTSSTAFYKDHSSVKKIDFGTLYWNEYSQADSTTSKKNGDKIDSGFFNIIDPQNQKSDSNNYFVPDEYVKKNSYPTVYEMLSGNAPLGTGATFTYGHITYDYATGTARDTQGSTIVYDNLKWGEDVNVKEASKKYLHQFFMQIIYGAVKAGIGAIEWKFSYPTALPSTLLSQYRNNTLNLLKTLQDDTGIILKSDNNSYYPESIVSAEHFQNHFRVPTVVCVDIGGGTTDISVWNRGLTTENLLQTSIKLASRDIFLPTFWNLIKSDDKISERVLNLKPLVKKYADERNYNLGEEDLPKVESILFEYEEAVKSCADIISDVSVQKRFEKILSFGFLSLLIYTMDSIAMVKDKLADDTQLTVCIGGNGSKLIEWLPFEYVQKTENILTQYLKDEYNLDYKIEVKKGNSDELKTEAVKGLLTIAANAANFANNLMLPASEEFIIEKFDGTSETIASDTDMIKRADIKDFFDNKGFGNQSIAAPDGETLCGIKNIKVNSELKTIRKIIEYSNKLNYAVFEDKDYLLSYTEEEYKAVHAKMQYELIQATRDGRMDPAFVFGVKAILKNENNKN